MRRLVFAACVLSLSACDRAPLAMHATEASELLERFASGEIDVCSDLGRAALRGAVRSYGAAMAQAGENWPVVPAADVDPDTLKTVDMSVVVAVATGFVELSDLQQAARKQVASLALQDIPAVATLRAAAGKACAEAFELHRAAARFVMETERYQRAVQRAVGTRDARTMQLLRRQAQRVEFAQSQMDMLAAAASAAVARAQS